MSDKNKIIFLWIATVIIIVAYLFWKPIFWATGGDLKLYEEIGTVQGGFDIYHIGQALFMLMLCWLINYIWRHTVTFILFWLCFGNFIDELFFDNTTCGEYELGFAVLVFALGIRYDIKRNEKNIFLRGYKLVVSKIKQLRENRK